MQTTTRRYPNAADFARAIAAQGARSGTIEPARRCEPGISHPGTAQVDDWVVCYPFFIPRRP